MKRTDRTSVHTILLCILLAGIIAPLCPADEQDTSLALLDIKNMTYDPRYDYLEGIIWGLLLYDFSRVPGLSVVERQDLEHILVEQRLQLQGITGNEDEAIRVGDLLGADYLLHGTYVFLGEDIILTLTSTRVADGRTSSFSDRGHTENLIHSLAEKVTERLSGTLPELVSAEGNRSIISLKDESPGSMALHSPLIDAEIYLDGEFYGYTTGDMRTPFIIEPLSPGKHNVETRYGRDFGVVDQPEITFRHWKETVDIAPGKREVLRDESRHFNDIIYSLMKLKREDIRSDDLRQDPIRVRETVSFTDREGVEHQILLTIESSYSDGDPVITCGLVYDGKEETLEVPVLLDKETEHELSAGLVQLEVDISSRYNHYEVDYSLWRRDIEQNMWR